MEILLVRHGEPVIAEIYADITAGRYEKIGWNSHDAFQERVTQAWRELLDSLAENVFSSPTMGGTTGVVLSHVLGISTHALFDATPFASITRVQVDGGGARRRTLHEIAPFDGQRDRALGPKGEGFSIWSASR
ncbi:MAG: hypothetical protein CL933_15490 [Deltaproteobacteria bacterium]|nr:hypothetical protein [Deltaproteobacteria bacterium]